MKRATFIVAFHLFLTLSQSQVVLCFSNTVRFLRIKELDGVTCPNEKAEKAINVTSRSQCMDRCLKKSICKCVLFEPAPLNCTICSSQYLFKSAEFTNIAEMTMFFKPQDYSSRNQTLQLSKLFVYRLFRSKRDWESAKERCIRLGGYLTSIKSKEEQTYLANLIEANSKAGIWTGGKGRYGDSSSFKWLDGSYVSTYENWYGNQPSQMEGLECIKVSKQTGFQWKTHNCTDEYDSICKFEYTV